MDNKVLDEAVEVALSKFYGDTDWTRCLHRDAMRDGLIAGVKVLLGPVVEAWRKRVGDDQYVSVDDAILDCIDEAEAIYAPSLGEGDGR